MSIGAAGRPRVASRARGSGAEIPAPRSPWRLRPVTGAGGTGTGTRLRLRGRGSVSGLRALMVGADLAGAVAFVALWPLLTVREAAILVAAVLVCRGAVDLYRPRLRLSYFDDVPRAMSAVSIGLVLVLGVQVLLLGVDPPASHLLLGAGVLLVLGEIQRATSLAVARRVRRRTDRGERTLIVGYDEVAVELVRAMTSHPEFGLRPVGLLGAESLDDPPTVTLVRRGTARRVGSRTAVDPSLDRLEGELAEIVPRHEVTSIVIAFSLSDTEAVELATVGDRLGCTVLALPRLFELYGEGRGVERLRSFPLVRLCADPTRRTSWLLKRTVDRVVALLALILLLPLLGALALLVLVDGGRPVIFSQERVGAGGRLFRLHKFRSLRPADAHEGDTRWSIDDDPRVSRVGRLLRRTSLDELPQVWNVLRGDMSIVGPRPERPAFVERFSATHGYYAARHRVPSGLTGLAQVNGLRGDTSIADRARYDNYYIASWSLWLDVRIVCLTVGELLRHARG